MSLTPALIIQRKRDGKELSRDQIRFFIQGLSNGDFTDYQATALLMAIFFRGMTQEETVALTEAMIESGERYHLDSIPGFKVDKHSTGGVGDKVSLILAPLVAACGVKVPMMSGRGLGHTGGTVDKLESIPGFNMYLSRSKFDQALEKVGCAMIAQSEQIAPADRKLYALRDVTATIECIPLITASILSKKIAEGTNGLVLDVKVGNGAFMKNKEQALKLARSIVKVSELLGVKCRAVLSNMDQPLGYAAGNALEVSECIEILKGAPEHQEGGIPSATSADLKELTLQLAAHMIQMGGIEKTLPAARRLAQSKLNDGSAWKLFEEMVHAQGGTLKKGLPQAPETRVWHSKKKGYLSAMDTEAIGRILVELGAGRLKTADPVDPAVGLIFHRKLGGRVKVGDPLVTVHFSPKRPGLHLEQLEARFQTALTFTPSRKPVPKLIIETLGKV